MSGGGRAGRAEQVRGILERAALGAVVLRRPENFAWYSGGADNRVDHSAATGVAAIVVTPDGEYVVTDNIEAPRIREEQTPGWEVVEYQWHAGPGDLYRQLADGAPVGSDAPVPSAGDGDAGAAAPARGEVDVAALVAPLRYQLDDDAVARYRAVAADAVAAVDAACATFTPAVTEFEAAGTVAGACRAAGLYAPALMVAGAARLPRYRHPIPAGGPLGARVMVVVCAERGGLYANLTRFVHFEPPDADLAAKLEACQGILVQLRAATRPGRTLAEVFDDCRAFYAEAGHPDGWRHHHQGGLTGYKSREVIAAPGVDLEIAASMAFAWNPSLPGAKAEETFVLTPDGPEVLCR